MLPFKNIFSLKLQILNILCMDRDEVGSSAGEVTDCELCDRISIPGRSSDFSPCHHVQTASGAYRTDTRVFFPGS
jgi:hypothetical protein